LPKTVHWTWGASLSMSPLEVLLYLQRNS
jgi:hypothetical protein